MLLGAIRRPWSGKALEGAGDETEAVGNDELPALQSKTYARLQLQPKALFEVFDRDVGLALVAIDLPGIPVSECHIGNGRKRYGSPLA